MPKPASTRPAYKMRDIVFVEVETEGDNLEAGDTFGSIEAVKDCFLICICRFREVLEFNSELEDQPDLVKNKDPYGKGWIIIKIEDEAQLDGLLRCRRFTRLLSNFIDKEGTVCVISLKRITNTVPLFCFVVANFNF